MLAERTGWGRIHVKIIPAEGASYLGKYLTKEGRAPCFKGWRLWAAFGPWKWTKVKDVKFESEFSTIIRDLLVARKGRGSYFQRLALADEFISRNLLIIAINWKNRQAAPRQKCSFQIRPDRPRMSRPLGQI